MAIKINNLSFVYMKKTPNETKAIDNISLEIPEGKVTAIIGHTGSGKSTLIQTFNGLLTPSSGTVEIDDFVITNNSKKNKNINFLKRRLKKMSPLV